MLLYNEKREGEWRGGAGINKRNVMHAPLCLLVDMLRGGGGGSISQLNWTADAVY